MEVMLPTLVGLAAGCIGTYSFVFQVLKCWRTGETGAISLRMFALRTFGAALWTFYGFVIWSLPVLIFSAIGLFLCATILVLKIRGDRSTSAEVSKQLA